MPRDSAFGAQLPVRVPLHTLAVAVLHQRFYRINHGATPCPPDGIVGPFVAFLQPFQYAVDMVFRYRIADRVDQAWERNKIVLRGFQRDVHARLPCGRPARPQVEADEFFRVPVAPLLHTFQEPFNGDGVVFNDDATGARVLRYR